MKAAGVVLPETPDGEKRLGLAVWSQWPSIDIASYSRQTDHLKPWRGSCVACRGLDCFSHFG